MAQPDEGSHDTGSSFIRIGANPLVNMTSDGTNSFSWDAENRMIKITYPGTNNFSSFVYDGLGRNVSIVETTAGSVTSTKQFVWAWSSDKMRRYQTCEERDATGVLTKKFFGRGQMNSTTKYFYDLEHLGSIREMTDNTGVVQAQYAFDPFGQVTRISESAASDFGYAGYYLHSRSELNLTRTRAYSSLFARFISRDPIEEEADLNLYVYVGNKPVNLVDPSGLIAASTVCPNNDLYNQCVKNCYRDNKGNPDAILECVRTKCKKYLGGSGSSNSGGGSNNSTSLTDGSNDISDIAITNLGITDLRTINSLILNMQK